MAPVLSKNFKNGSTKNGIRDSHKLALMQPLNKP